MSTTVNTMMERIGSTSLGLTVDDIRKFNREIARRGVLKSVSHVQNIYEDVIAYRLPSGVVRLEGVDVLHKSGESEILDSASAAFSSGLLPRTPLPYRSSANATYPSRASASAFPSS